MCTVTIIRTSSGLRMACNRDEQRSRLAAMPPAVRRFGPVHAIMPIDRTSKGTWIAVNDAGIAACVLNVNNGVERPPERTPLSRGSLIPAVMPCQTLGEAATRALAVDVNAYAPFHVLITNGTELVEVRFDGNALTQTVGKALAEPLLFTSSGIGDGMVLGPRRNLFEKCLRHCDLVQAQDAFHLHSWPEYPHLSVCMRRPDAMTVSHAIVHVGPSQIGMTYYGNAPDVDAPTTVVTLPRRRELAA